MVDAEYEEHLAAVATLINGGFRQWPEGGNQQRELVLKFVNREAVRGTRSTNCCAATCDHVSDHAAGAVPEVCREPRRNQGPDTGPARAVLYRPAWGVRASSGPQGAPRGAARRALAGRDSLFAVDRLHQPCV